LAVFLTTWFLIVPGQASSECRAWKDFFSFDVVRDDARQEWVWTSPTVQAAAPFRELILSWNMEFGWAGQARFEAGIVEEGAPVHFYELGWWCAGPGEGASRSVRGQKDERGEVQTDTLVLRNPAKHYQVRFRTSAATRQSARSPIRFLAVSLWNDAESAGPAREPGASAHELQSVPRYCQLDHAGGSVWCSPTSVSMVLGHWAKTLGRPDLDVTVPFVAGEVFDPAWPGTGNWSFNVAFAGSFPKMRAYAARFSGLEELWAWTSRGIPVPVSVCYNRLKQEPGPTSGHLVVCVGRAEDGGVIVHDPGSRSMPRRVVSREVFLRAWAHSNQTVYVVHPEGTEWPGPPGGAWLE